MLTAFPGTSGTESLYDDAGKGFGYTHGQFTRTVIAQKRSRNPATLAIAAAKGKFPGALGKRSWIIRFLTVKRPRAPMSAVVT